MKEWAVRAKVSMRGSLTVQDFAPPLYYLLPPDHLLR